MLCLSIPETSSNKKIYKEKFISPSIKNAKGMTRGIERKFCINEEQRTIHNK